MNEPQWPFGSFGINGLIVGYLTENSKGWHLVQLNILFVLMAIEVRGELIHSLYYV